MSFHPDPTYISSYLLDEHDFHNTKPEALDVYLKDRKALDRILPHRDKY